MNKDYISYEQALELKELGFDEPCIAFYEPGNKEVQVVGVNQRYNDPSLLTVTDFCAPLYQQAFRWFREKYGIMYTVDNNIIGNTFHGSYTKINSDYQSDYTDDFATYEEAELACLKKLIEIVKRVKLSEEIAEEMSQMKPIVDVAKDLADHVDKMVLEQMIEIVKQEQHVRHNNM